MVSLEMAYLHEIDRINELPETILGDLNSRLGLIVSNVPFNRVIAQARTLTWTHDPFDRIIAGHAFAENVGLVTKDQLMLKHLENCIWG